MAVALRRGSMTAAAPLASRAADTTPSLCPTLPPAALAEVRLDWAVLREDDTTLTNDSLSEETLA